MTYVVEAACVMAALVFGASAAAKLASRNAYRRYRAAMAGLLPPALAGGLAAAELAVALGLGAAAITGARAPVALGAAALLTCLLIAGVAVMIRRGVRARCACFGTSEPIGVTHLVRNLTLLGLVLAGLAASLSGAGTRQAAAAVMAVVAGGCLALLIVRWEDLAVLVTPVTPRGPG
ncbi:MAG TPA: MauE/DoxX family redox-associated membrane protein [Streptosporangiaceae bacterium]|nr:MauE/DoxX family redox-associated membrane protein [Streptosporangiaceae bacterium]